MSFENQITTILEQAEHSLREIIAKAAQEGDYHSVDNARVAALEMEKLRKRVKGPPTVEKPQDSQRFTGKSKKAAYPKFEIRNETLIRTGWSKKKGQEYRQRIPQITFDQTLEAMASLSQMGNGSVLAEQIIERVGSISSEHVPSYQVYAVLGLLRHGKCIQVGGDGYYSWSDQLQNSARQAWAECEE